MMASKASPAALSRVASGVASSHAAYSACSATIWMVISVNQDDVWYSRRSHHLPADCRWQALSLGLIVGARQSRRVLDRRAIGRPSWSLLLTLQCGPAAVTLDINFEYRGMMNKPVDGGEGHGWVGEDLSPFPERLIRGDEDRPAFVSRADELKENRGLRLILADISKIIKDQ